MSCCSVPSACGVSAFLFLLDDDVVLAWAVVGDVALWSLLSPEEL